MPAVLPLQIRKAPTISIYEVARTRGGGMTGNRLFSSSRDGTFYDPIGSNRRWNCGATGFEFVKPSSGSPTYRYYPSMNSYNWNDDFLLGQPTYADSGHSNYAFWQSVSSNLYSFLNTYHVSRNRGGLPTNKLIKVWVSWDKYVSVSPRGFYFSPNLGKWRYDSYRRFSYLATSPAGVCCRYAIFS